MVGLGKMGANMVRRLMRDGHECVVFDQNAASVAQLVLEGATGAASLQDLTDKLILPRSAWIMVPSGEATEAVVSELAGLLASGDVIIDGGNSNFKDDVRRAGLLAAKGIAYLDAGTSGGVWGIERGYCLMVGGDAAAVHKLSPVFASLAPAGEKIAGADEGDAGPGWLHCGPSGAGHFVKMVHNGIEYGLMQAYGEGFEILKQANAVTVQPEQRYDLDLAAIAQLWRHGSVVSSWLLDLTAEALVHNPELSNYSGFVNDSGEGRWAVQAAIDERVSADVISAALYARFRSRQEHTFAEKVLSAMRAGFGGHAELEGK
jgi:6-phosphogluconate dehydrogenase